MLRMMLKTLSPRLFALDFFFLVITLVCLMPFLTSDSTLDPGLIPRFLLWAIVLLVLLLSFSVQAAAGDLHVDLGLLRHVLFLAFLGYLLSCLASLAQAPNIGEAFLDLAKVLLSVVFLPVALIILARKSAHICLLAQAVVLSAIGLSIIGFCQYFGCGGASASRHFAMTGTMGNKNLFASILFLMLPFCLYAALGFRRFWRLAGVCATAAILSAVLLSRTRAVWLALLVSCILTAALLLWRSCRCGLGLSADMRRSMRGGARHIAIVILILGGIAGLLHLRGHSPADLRASVWDATSLHHRLTIWKNTLAMIADHGLCGVGIGNWKVVVPSYGVPEEASSDWGKTAFYVRPHNDFLWVLSETGAIGLGFYASIFIVLLFYLVRLMRRPGSDDEVLLSLLMFFGVTGYLVNSMFCFPRERVFHSVLLLLMVSVVHILYYRDAPSRRNLGRLHLGGLIVVAFLLVSAAGILGCVRLRAEIHTRRALVARAAGDYRTVIAEIDKAYSPLATLDPTSTPLKWYRGEAHFLTNGLAEALKDYERAVVDHPYHIHVLNNLATCYQMTGHPDRAVFYYGRLLHIFPGFAEAACNLAAVHFNAGEYEKAREVLVRCDPRSENPLVERYGRIVAEKRETRAVPPGAQGRSSPDGPLCEPTPPAADGLLRALHRLWSATRGRYFYTVDAGERDAFLARRDETWIYEGIACRAFADNCLSGLSPVHRFYGPQLRAYFYTIQPDEVQKLTQSGDGRWQHEGVAFYAFPAGRQPADACPVYRFWSGRLGYHFFTIDPKERDRLQTRHSDTWTFEGIAWYAYR